MPLARLLLPGWPAPLGTTVTADGRAVLDGAPVPIPAGAFAPAATGVVHGVLMNETSTLERFGAALKEPPYKEPPTQPVLYFKTRNTLAGHGAVIALPAFADAVELGASVGMVFARDVGRAGPEEALEAVGGFTIVLDLSVPHESVYRPPIAEKCFDGSCPIGPWVTAAAEVGDPTRLKVRTYVNGTLVATRGFDDLLRGPAALIAETASFMTYHAGDVLTLGFPIGAVPTARRGDHIRIEVDRLGALECTIAEGKQ